MGSWMSWIKTNNLNNETQVKNEKNIISNPDLKVLLGKKAKG